jgi:hypothetical protein
MNKMYFKERIFKLHKNKPSVSFILTFLPWSGMKRTNITVLIK